MASVKAQTVAVEHLVWMSKPSDELNPGDTSRACNVLRNMASTEWVSLIQDDDLLLPYHVEVLAPYLDTREDVLYTYCTTKGTPRVDVTGWSGPQLVSELETRNLIMATATIRRSALERVGGWEEDYDVASHRFASGFGWEDWDLWYRMAFSGCRFRCIPIETWTYRTGDWKRNSSVIEKADA